MKTAIIYASKHGTTKKVAGEISKFISHHDVTIHNLRENNKIDLTSFDQIIIGGSIHAGHIQKPLQKFLNQNIPSLLQKRLGLFLCCMYKAEAQNQFDRAFPDLLRNHALSCKCVGGEFIFEKMNFIEKIMTRKIAGIDQSVSQIDYEKIKELIREMN